jgi:exonuclease SbcC
MKIKSVDVTGFRAYASHGDGLFNFCEPNDVAADFVVIYAPNGFGKSSLFDAIEWAMTNNIGRYIRDSLRTNNSSTSLYLNNSNSAQNILRNRYISASAPSYVNVETTLGNFNRPLKRAALGRRDYKFDPKETDENTKHLSEIFLSQDAVDAFLKEEKPEARYEKFMTEFGGDDEDYRLKLYALRRSCNQEIKSLRERISQLNQEIQNLAYQEGLHYVGGTIQQLHAMGLSFASIDENYDEVAHVRYKNEVLKARSELSSALDEQRYQQLQLQELIDKVYDIERAKDDLNFKRQRLHHLLENRQAFEQRDATLRSIYRSTQELLALSNSQAAHTEARQKFGIYVELRKESSEIKIKKRELVNNREKIEIETSSNRARLIAAQDHITILESELNFATQEQIAAPSRYAEIELKEGELKLLKNKKDIVNRNIELSNAVQSTLTAEIKRLGSIVIEAGSLYSSTVAAFGPDEHFIGELNTKLRTAELLRTTVERYNAEQTRINSDSNKIYELVNLANELLRHAHSNTCPLCKHEFSSTQELSDRILDNDALTKQQQELTKLRETAEKELSDLSSEINQNFEKLKENKEKKLNALQNDLDEEIAKQSSHKASLLLLETQISEVESTVSKLKNVLLGLEIDEYLEISSLRIKEISEKKEKFYTQITDVKSILEANIEKLKENSVALSQLTTREDQIATHESFTATQRYLAAHLVADDNAENFFSLHAQYLFSQISDTTQFLAEHQATLLSQDQNLRERYNISTLDEVISELSKADNELKKAEGTMSIYHSKLKLFAPDIDVSISSPDDIKASLQEKIAQAASIIHSAIIKMELIDLLSSQLNHVLPYMLHSAKKTELKEQQHELLKHERLDLLLNQEFSAVETRLKERIDNFFYTPLINSIYSKIDPHPSFKRIEFVCIFPESERPRLEVYVYEDENRAISPNLYFSAAQLNILSLSIFLARALHVKHEGKEVETILIDDPIQSMDSINILSTIDLLRNISIRFNRQIVLSTHDENFYELLKRKVPSASHRCKFIRLESYGRVSELN